MANIAGNPFLGPEWEPLAQMISITLERAKTIGHMSMDTYGHDYGLSPNTSPYFQADWRNGGLLLEAAGNLSVRPKLSVKQYAEMQFYGWLLPGEDHHNGAIQPGPDVDDYAEGPNFVRKFDLGVDTMDVAEVILTAMAGVYKLTIDDFVGFPQLGAADAVDSFHKLYRLPWSDGNPMRVIFANPGRHEADFEPKQNKTDAPPPSLSKPGEGPID